jgi:hypothetical protein
MLHAVARSLEWDAFALPAISAVLSPALQGIGGRMDSSRQRPHAALRLRPLRLGTAATALTRVDLPRRAPTPRCALAVAYMQRSRVGSGVGVGMGSVCASVRACVGTRSVRARVCAAGMPRSHRSASDRPTRSPTVSAVPMAALAARPSWRLPQMGTTCCRALRECSSRLWPRAEPSRAHLRDNVSIHRGLVLGMPCAAA